jgi:hypothetical protein
MKCSTFFSNLIAAATVVVATTSLAASIHFVDPALPGTTQYDEWDNLTAGANPGFPGFPGSGAWPNAIGSNVGASGDATLEKTANGTGGGPYPAGASIYYGGFSAAINNDGGTLAVSDATPVANLANVVFQLEIGEAWTFDFFNDVLPTLSYNGGAQNLAATDAYLLHQLDNGTVTMPTGEETVYINTHLLQWDLSGIGDGPITDFEISFTGVQHAQLYGLQLDQSDSYSRYEPVPEPASAALLAICLGVAAAKRRRRM